MINLPQARALVEAATQGEWTVDDGHPDDYIGIAYASDDDRGHVATIVEYRRPQGLRDARSIAASRQLVPELLDEVERLRVLLSEACEIGIRLAGLECSSADEDRLTTIAREAGDK